MPVYVLNRQNWWIYESTIPGYASEEICSKYRHDITQVVIIVDKFLILIIHILKLKLY